MKSKDIFRAMLIFIFLFSITNAAAQTAVVTKGFVTILDQDVNVVVNGADEPTTTSVTSSESDTITFDDTDTNVDNRLILTIDFSNQAGSRTITITNDDNSTSTFTLTANSQADEIFNAIDSIAAVINDDSTTMTVSDLDLRNTSFDPITIDYKTVNKAFYAYNYSKGQDVTLIYNTSLNYPVIVSQSYASNDFGTYARGINEDLLSALIAANDYGITWSHTASQILDDVSLLNTYIPQVYSQEVTTHSSEFDITVVKTGNSMTATYDSTGATDAQILSSVDDFLQEYINYNFNSLTTTSFINTTYTISIDHSNVNPSVNGNYAAIVTYTDGFGNSGTKTVTFTVSGRTSSSSGGSSSSTTTDTATDTTTDTTTDSGAGDTTTDSSTTETSTLESTDAIIAETDSLISEANDLISSDPEAASQLADYAASNQESSISTVLNDVNTIESMDVNLAELDIGLTAEEFADEIVKIKELQEQLENLEDLSPEEKLAAIESIQAEIKDILVKIPQVEEISTKEDVITLEESVDALEEMAGAEIPSEVKSLPIAKNVQINRKVTSYEITDRGTNDKKIKSKIELSFVPTMNAEEMNIVEVIPKSVASHVDKISFGVKPKVINPDPTVMWELTNIVKGKKVDLSYVVDNEIDEKVFAKEGMSSIFVKEADDIITGSAIGAGNKTSGIEWIGLLILIALPLLGLATAAIIKKRKQRF